MINLNEIKALTEIKISSRWVNINFQQQIDKIQAEYFSYNFKTKNREEVSNFLLKPIEQKNQEIELEEGEKKFSIINFLIGFLA